LTDLFLSYKAEDRARVAPLVEALEADGYSVWWDADIAGGEDWRATICRYLDAARCVIVVWSRQSVGPGGHFVRDEATRALRRGVYLPVKIDKVEPPLGFGETQVLNIQAWNGDRERPEYQAVLAAIQSRLGDPGRAIAATPRAQGIDRRLLIAGGAAVTVTVAAGGWLIFRPADSKEDSIAVMPFANLSGDPNQAYFSDGIAEELRSALSRVAGLTVVARTSSEAVRNDDAKTAARKLEVGNILAGSVRQSPATIRVSAQLVDGRTGVEKWSETYDRIPGDVIKIQTDIAQKVASALAIALTGAVVVLGGTTNAAAQNLVLKAIALANKGGREDLQTAQSLLDGALEIDPNYAEAYVQKARVLSDFAGNFAGAEELPRYRADASRNARRALAIAPSLASAHNALAEIHRVSLEFKDADREYRRALELAPHDAATLRDTARFASQLGRRAEALRLVDQAIALDPLNPASYTSRLWVLTANRQFAEGVDYARTIEARWPDLVPWLEVAFCLINLDRLDEAQRIASKLDPGDSSGGGPLAEALINARAGRASEAERYLAIVRRDFGDAASYQYAQVYSVVGDKPRALGELERALDIRDSGLLWLKVDPTLDPLRNEPRFKAIVSRLDFPS
jgi:serine/threonine-protein kinase